MYIDNVNEKIRGYFAGKFGEISEFDDSFVDEFLEHISSIKDKNYSFYERILQAFYPIFYISNLERIGEIESLKKIEVDYDAEDEFVYDVEYLKSIDSLEALIEEVEKEQALLIDMLISNLSFHNQTELEKRGLLVEYKVCDEYLKKISNTWILDRLDYCRKYTKEEFYNRCFEIKKSSLDGNDSNINMISSSIEFLKELSIFDVETFLGLFDLIIEDSYTYLKYCDLYEESNDNIKKVIYKIENENNSLDESIINDNVFSSYIIEYFFKFNSFNPLEIEKIKNLISKNKIYIKDKYKK